VGILPRNQGTGTTEKTRSLTYMSQHIVRMMKSRDVSPDELEAALEDLDSLMEEHGQAARLAFMFEDDAIREAIGQR